MVLVALVSVAAARDLGRSHGKQPTMANIRMPGVDYGCDKLTGRCWKWFISCHTSASGTCREDSACFEFWHIDCLPHVGQKELESLT